jgi:hypothetical protein
VLRERHDEQERDEDVERDRDGNPEAAIFPRLRDAQWWSVRAAPPRLVVDLVHSEIIRRTSPKGSSAAFVERSGR